MSFTGFKVLAASGLAVAMSAFPVRMLAQQKGADMPPASSSASTPSKPAETSPKKGIVFHKFESKSYTIETPEGWEVGEETPFGQREILPGKSASEELKASMSSMTGPGLGKQSWDQLYATSNYFITRFNPNGTKMVATPYKLGKSKQGFETCSWTMNSPTGDPLQRLVILKHTNGNILALGVKIPPSAAKESREKLELIFHRMVDSAVVK